MLPLLLLAFAPGEDPSWPEPSLTVHLIRELDEDTIEIRNAAVRSLLRSGMPILPELEKASRRPRSPEQAVRIQEVRGTILRTHRLKGFAWGEEVRGFVGSLRCSKTETTRDGELTFRFHVMNVGNTARPFVPFETHNVRSPGYFFTTHVAHGVLKVSQISGEPPSGGRGGGVSSSHSRGPDRTALNLNPGEEWSGELKFGISKYVNPGEYEAQIIYFARSQVLIPGAQDELRTNTVRFRVVGE